MFSKIDQTLAALKNDRDTRDFMAHNRVYFKDRFGRKDTGPEVLFELNAISVSHVACSYLATVLSKRHGASIKGYAIKPQRSFMGAMASKVARLLSSGKYGVYKSFGASDFVSPVLTAQQSDEAKRISSRVLGQLTCKRDIIDIAVEGVWLGDLICDSFLKEFAKATIDTADAEFIAYLAQAMGIYVFWRDYFNAHDVRAVNVSHCVYLTAVPLRIALSKGIEAYQINATHAYRMTDKRQFAYTDFKDFHTTFQSLPQGIQRAGVEEAKRRIDLRFSGKVGVDMRYSTKSAYGESKHDRLLKDTKNIKVLIATHCFFDSPHSFGRNLFPDFYEWIDYLGQVSLETDYDWYIKTHPDYLEGTKDIIDAFVAKYPKFNLLPADSSHHQIIAEGIDFALTCYGTIGFEYAALGVPVINASLNNRHIAYGFNIHPENVDEYGALLSDLGRVQLDIDLNDVYEYYFMSKLYNTENWLFQDYYRMEEAVGGRKLTIKSAVYRQWLNEWDEERHAALLRGLDHFVRSGDFRLGYQHFGCEFNMKETAPV